MGRYFGVINKSKNHKVSEGKQCFKGGCFNINEIMHRYGWDSEDVVVTGCYDSYYKYDFVDGESIQRDITYYGYDAYEEKEEQEKIRDIVSNNPETLTGFGLEEDKLEHCVDHYPTWNNNKVCTKCQYQFSEQDIENDKALWETVFFWS